MNNTNKEILEISIEDIIPNRFQPRLTFDVEALNELASSIKEHGIIQPLVVRRLQDKFEIIAGERRYKAATLVGMQKVPCIVMELNDNESAEVAVIENIQRKEMTPLEEAKSFKKILDKGYLTQEELAKKMGKSQSSIANKLRLLNLDETIQDAILNNKISERHARSILKIQSKEEQRKILTEILEKRLTVKQTDELIKERYGVDNVNNETNSVDSIFKTNNINESINLEQKKEMPIPNSFMSRPEATMPTTNNMDLNPQLNLMNGNTFIDVSEVEPKTEPQSQSTEIFKYDTPSANNLSQKETDIQSIINPSVFSSDSINNNVSIPNANMNNNVNIPNINNFDIPNYAPSTNNMNVDINTIKQNAEDINPTREPVNIDNLLANNEMKKENKFFVDLNVPTNIFNQNTEKFNKALQKINEKVNEIKLEGTNIIKEEKDLGNSYEIIIRIDK